MIAVSVALLLTIAAAGTGLLWWGQERLVFQPGGPPYPVAGAERLEYRADDGQPLLAYVVGNRDTPRGVLIAFHGNADLAAARVVWAEELARRTGWLVMLPEWRGYAGLPGRPTADGVRRDAHAALRVAVDSLGAHAGHLALYGHSLGSAVAAELSNEANPTALLLESPLTSARDMARIVVARPVELVWSMISRVHYDTRHRVSELAAPVSVAHGVRDFIIPVRMGEAVFAAARRKGALLIVQGAGHNDVAEVAGDAYWQWVAEALH